MSSTTLATFFCLFFTFILQIQSQYPNCHVTRLGKKIDLTPLYLPTGEYSAISGDERYFLNVCGDAKTTCQHKKYPVVHGHHGGCGHLGTRYFTTKSSVENGRIVAKLLYPQGVNQNGIKSNTEIFIKCPKGTNTTTMKFIKHRYENKELFFEFELITNKIEELCKPTIEIPKCGIKTRFGTIDLSSLARPNSEYEDSSGFEKFFVNICTNAKTPCDGKQYPITNDYFGTCGYLGTLEKTTIKLKNENNPNEVLLTYAGGMNGGVQSITEILFVCNKEIETPKFRYVQHRYENDMFIFEFKMESKNSCPQK